MAVFPNATFMPLAPEADEQPAIRPTMVIVHTYVGNPTLASDLAMLGKHNKQEHHFYLRVGGTELSQHLSTETRADNQFRANEFQVDGVRCGAISIETGDRFHSDDAALSLSWTALDQFDTLVDLIAWCCETHAIPARRCPAPFEPGIGYHSMWGFNKRGPGDGPFGSFTDADGRNVQLHNPWTNAIGKSCPGPGKIAEFPQLVAAVAARLGTPLDDMDDPTARDVAMRSVPWIGELRASPAVSDQARAVQWRLTVLGFPPVGGVDGNYGSKSAAACEQFQAAAPLPVTGIVDKATWRALGLRDPDAPATTEVRSGEGWMAIARRALGNERRWREIRDLNGGVGHKLHPGDVVVLPNA